MHSIDRPPKPVPNVLNLIGMAAGVWAVIGLAITSAWPPRSPQTSPIETGASWLLAYPPDPPDISAAAASPARKQASRTMARAHVKYRRKRGAATTFATRTLSSRISLN